MFLRSHQLTESLGWSPADTAYGGWGYAVRPPRKPAGSGRPPFDADLSSTLFAVGALRCAGVPTDDPAIRVARRFVEQCQNFAPNDADADLDDGGFFLTPTNPGQNKAGVRSTDRVGRRRYASYGSATADGLRALLRCGLDADHPRVQAAHRWLERNFDAETNPGVFAPARTADRDGPYFYWCWSVAHALRACGAETIERDGVTIDWAAVLAAALVRRQRADGSWANPISFTKEDDPLIATPLAAAALANCRLAITARVAAEQSRRSPARD